jgi:hypothetical protein
MLKNVIFNLKMVDPETNQPWAVVCGYTDDTFLEENKPLVVFYDERYPSQLKRDEGEPLGQKVSTYYASTLIEDDTDYALSLYEEIKDWTLSKTFMKRLISLLRSILY